MEQYPVVATQIGEHLTWKSAVEKVQIGQIHIRQRSILRGLFTFDNRFGHRYLPGLLQTPAFSMVTRLPEIGIATACSQ